MSLKSTYLQLLLLVMLFTACSSPVSLQEAKQLIESPENGLTLSIKGQGFTYKLSLWPANYVQAINPSNQNGARLSFFQLNTDKPEFMFRASEENFKLIIKNKTYPATIVFAENLGSNQANKVMIGFPAELFTDNCTLLIKDYNQQTLAEAQFSLSSYKKVENLNIQQDDNE